MSPKGFYEPWDVENVCEIDGSVGMLVLFAELSLQTASLNTYWKTASESAISSSVSLKQSTKKVTYKIA